MGVLELVPRPHSRATLKDQAGVVEDPRAKGKVPKVSKAIF
jgi:hypothetical protein